MSGTYGNPYFSSPVDFRIPGGAPSSVEPATRAALEEVYGSLNIIARTLVNYAGIGPQVYSSWENLNGSTRTLLGGNLQRFYCFTGEDIAYGELVCIYNIAGTPYIARANATDNTRPTIGYCNTPGGVMTSDTGEFILNNGILSTAGLTPGAVYYTSTTPGALTSVRPVAAGNIEQFVGIAISSTELNFHCAGFIQH